MTKIQSLIKKIESDRSLESEEVGACLVGATVEELRDLHRAYLLVFSPSATARIIEGMIEEYKKQDEKKRLIAKYREPSIASAVLDEIQNCPDLFGLMDRAKMKREDVEAIVLNLASDKMITVRTEGLRILLTVTDFAKGIMV